MKMRILHLVFLGLLAAVHSTPVNIATQIPAEPKVDVIQEAITDGFLIPHYLIHSPSTEGPKINATIQAPQQPSTDSMTEGGAKSSFAPATEFESGDSTALSSSPAQSSTSPEESMMNRIFYPPTGESPEISTTTQTSVNHFSDFMTEGSAFMTEGSADSSPATTIEFGGGDSATLSNSPAQSSTSPKESMMNRIFYPPIGESPEISTTTQTSVNHFSDFMTEGSTDPTLTTTKEFRGGEYTTLSVSGSASEDSEPKERINNAASTLLTASKTETTEKATKQVQHPMAGKLSESGHSTPDWIIILGFIVGLAALIMLCAAIATRDKWNGPKKEPRDETKTNSSNQMRELEMQTFLHKEQPRENGKEAEYTVLSVEDLPGAFSSD